jgi:DNA-binding MarR family transcriptional regulator
MRSNILWPQCTECGNALPSICHRCAEKQREITLNTPLDEARPAVRNTDPTTSHSAYSSLGRRKISERHQEALRICRMQNGATNSEIARALGLPRDSVSPRVAELRHAGLIIAAGKRCDPGSRRAQLVWVPMDKGKREGAAHDKTRDD